MSLSPESAGPDGFPDTTLACVQMEPRVGHKAGNIARSLALIEQAAAQGAALVVLPELCSSGYSFVSRDEAFALAEELPGGEACEAWSAAARRLGIHLVAGVAEREAECLYNSAVVLGPQGYIGKYRKLHLWSQEHLFFEPGNLGLPVFATRIGRLGVAICYDGWFPEVYRLLAMRGADIVCMPTNWVPMKGQPAQRMAMANTLVMANAHCNGLSVACAGRIGTERGQPFIGQSLIVGAEGWPLAGPASADREEVLLTRLNLQASRQARHLNPFNDVMRDRRGDVYHPMLGSGWPMHRP